MVKLCHNLYYINHSKKIRVIACAVIVNGGNSLPKLYDNLKIN